MSAITSRTMSRSADQLSAIEMLRAILMLQEQMFQLLDGSSGTKVEEQSWFSPTEVASQLKRQPYTVRHWCRTGRLLARKRPIGRGGKEEWEISAEELHRYRNHGLRQVTDHAARHVSTAHRP